jgi:uncharacterized protein HI_1523|nr:MAG TPA: DNA adenine methylase [Caudoviricetes sp.]
MSKRLYKKEPLPFIGQKKNFQKHFIEVLEKNIEGDGEGWTIIDVFGGSGLLAHTAKRIKPKAKVIYNDFDGYAERLKGIADTNRLREMLFEVVTTRKKDTRLSEDERAKVIDIVKNFDGYKDIVCINNWFLFAGRKTTDLEGFYYYPDFWKRISSRNYETADDYLVGLEITHSSYQELMPQYSGKEKCLLLLDPPYVNTQQHRYKGQFGLVDFLKMMSFVDKPFILFSSDKSEIIEYLEYVTTEKIGNYQNF